MSNRSGPVSEGEYRSGGRIGTALIDGFTFLSSPVQYVVIDGMAIFEGDINLGPVKSVQESFEVLRRELLPDPPPLTGIVITPGSQYAWLNCTIPYQIHAKLPKQDRVTRAIEHWQTNTDFNFVLRNADNEDEFPDYVEFVRGSGCSANIGRRGGRQTVTLSDSCSTGSCIHEIGHAAGLWHEQSRSDRDSYVTINWENIIPGAESNFTQHITDGDDVGGYDYDSIMHYSRKAFSVNGQDTIEPTDPNAQIGQRNGLSAGDIYVVNSVLCPTVPFLRERSATIAVQRIVAVGLVPKIVGTDGRGAWVWKQRPQYGTRVDRGSTVQIHLRTGPIP